MVRNNLAVLVWALVVVLSANAGIASADIVISWPNGTGFEPPSWSSITSIPLSRMSLYHSKDTLSFPSVSGLMMEYNQTSDPTRLQGAILIGYFPTLPPYRTHERWVLDMVGRYNPKGIIILCSRTLRQVESSHHDVDMSSVRIPVVAVIDDPKSNTEFRNGESVIVVTVILAPWSLINISFAVTAMIWNGKVANTAFMCLFLEIVASLIRFMWATDPYAMRYLPLIVADTFLSLSYPLTMSSVVLLTMFWHQITSRYIGAATSLAAIRKPAVLVVVFLIVYEVVINVSRCAIGDSGNPILIALAAVMYIIIELITLAYFAIIATRLRPFLKLRKEHSTNADARILRHFGIRIIVTITGMIMAAIALIVYLATQGVGGGAQAPYFALCWIQLSLNLMSSAQVWALWTVSKAKRAGKISPPRGNPHRVFIPSDTDSLSGSDFSIATQDLARYPPLPV